MQYTLDSLTEWPEAQDGLTDDERLARMCEPEQGMTPIADAAMQRFFSARTLGRGLPLVASMRATLLATKPAGYAGCCAAIRDMDHTALLGQIRIPTLVIAGDHDVSTPWTGHGEVLVQSIPGALAAPRSLKM